MRRRSSPKCSIRLMPGSSARWASASRALPIALSGSTIVGSLLRRASLIRVSFIVNDNRCSPGGCVYCHWGYCICRQGGHNRLGGRSKLQRPLPLLFLLAAAGFLGVPQLFFHLELEIV